jgi:hypothetical protein
MNLQSGGRGRGNECIQGGVGSPGLERFHDDKNDLNVNHSALFCEQSSTSFWESGVLSAGSNKSLTTIARNCRFVYPSTSENAFIPHIHLLHN